VGRSMSTCASCELECLLLFFAGLVHMWQLDLYSQVQNALQNIEYRFARGLSLQQRCSG
jgi:hypothetical protein